MSLNLTRRGLLGGLSGLAVLPAGRALAQSVPLPTSPVMLNIIDVAGDLQLTQAGIDLFAKQNPKLISRIVYSRAPSPELPAKLKAQQQAGRVDIDLVLTGPGALSDGIEQGLWIDVLKSHADLLPKPEDVYHEHALMMQKNFAGDFGMAVVYSPSGPLFEYMPGKLKTVPKTAADFLAWAKANPNRFTYARPYNSGPGWTYLMALPYILGDKDPKDPANGWEKSWAYMKELGTAIDYYPTGTAAMMKELGEGTRDVVISTCGWDINPRVLGIVPKEAEIFALDNTHWMPDTQFMCVPKGITNDKLAVVLALMSFLLKPEQQAFTYDKGYFYPGPAVKNVPLDMAPEESRAVIKEFGRPVYDDLIKNLPVETPLTPAQLVVAFRRWDQEIGAARK